MKAIYPIINNTICIKYNIIYISYTFLYAIYTHPIQCGAKWRHWRRKNVLKSDILYRKKKNIFFFFFAYGVLK
jgi:hypothetical protein